MIIQNRTRTMPPSLLSHAAADVAAELSRVLRPEEIACRVPLAALGRWRIGGPADVLVAPRSVEAVMATLAVLAHRDVPRIVIGDGSNLLFDDAGYRGVVIRIGRDLGGLTIGEGRRVTAGAGLWVPALVRRLVDAGLAGAVHAIGIPGTLGGLVTMNGGSQRRGIGEHVESVEVVDPNGARRTIPAAALDFAYRRSALQDGVGVVVGATLRFQPGDPAAMRREAIAILAARRAKFPRVRANCGSVFVSDPALYALIGPPGAAIEQVGLKGMRIGDAQFSPEHANFIVNTGRARSSDVLALIALARRRVEERTGVSMLAEVRYLPPGGPLHAAHEVTRTDPGYMLP